MPGICGVVATASGPVTRDAARRGLGMAALGVAVGGVIAALDAVPGFQDVYLGATIAVGGLGCLAGGIAGRQLGLDDDAMFLVMVAVLFVTSLTDRERFWGRPPGRS